ncbi:MAG: diguanylate cyclase, partial [Thermomonas sp.]
GGEEFVVVLPATQLVGAELVADKLCTAVRNLAIEHRGSHLGCVTVSIGGAVTIPSRDEPYAPLLEAADVALYDAKHAGKDRAVLRELA